MFDGIGFDKPLPSYKDIKEPAFQMSETIPLAHLEHLVVKTPQITEADLEHILRETKPLKTIDLSYIELSANLN